MFRFLKSHLRTGSPTPNVAQLHVVNIPSPTRIAHEGGGDVSSLIYDYVLFDPFQRSLEGKPIKVLDGIDRLRLEYRVVAQPDPDEKTRNFRKFLAALGEVRVEVLLNNVVIQMHKFTRQELTVSVESPVPVKDGVLTYEFQQSESGLYKDTEALYSKAITSNAQ